MRLLRVYILFAVLFILPVAYLSQAKGSVPETSLSLKGLFDLPLSSVKCAESRRYRQRYVCVFKYTGSFGDAVFQKFPADEKFLAKKSSNLNVLRKESSNSVKPCLLDWWYKSSGAPIELYSYVFVIKNKKTPIGIANNITSLQSGNDVCVTLSIENSNDF